MSEITLIVSFCLGVTIIGICIGFIFLQIQTKF